MMIGSMGKFSFLKALLLNSKRFKHFITTPIFYANGPPHIGHLYTALLADTLHRWELLKAGRIAPNEDTLFTTGTDEHGLKIQKTALAADCDPQIFCDNISNRFKDLLHDFNIRPTDFIRTTEARHKQVVEYIWKELEKRGEIRRGIYEGWYSTTDECFYAESDVYKSTEQGSVRMVNSITGSSVEWVQEENYVFRLSKYIDAIRNWLTSNEVISPAEYLQQALIQADPEKIGNISLSRDRKRVSWGIPVPNDDSQTIYVWFDALANYLTVSDIFTNKIKSHWPPTCQIIGKDILNVGNVTDPYEVSKVLTKEGLRYFLLRQGTPQSDANFTLLKSIQVINTDLVNNIGNLLQRSLNEKFIPTQTYPCFYSNSFQNDLFELGEPLIESLNSLPEIYNHLFDDMMIYKALEMLSEIVRDANRFFHFYEPWKECDDKKLSSLLYVCCEVLRICGILLQPAIPQYANNLLSRLGMDPSERFLDSAKFLPDSGYSGRAFGICSGPLMKRIPEIDVTKELAREL